MKHRLTAISMTSLFTVLTLLAVFSSGFCQVLNRVQPFGVSPTERQYRSVLNVTNGGKFGQWKWDDTCPVNYFAIGFSLRVESSQGIVDDTTLNGIRLHCATENHQGFMYTVESHSGFWGDWTSPQYCPSGVLTAFQLQVGPHVGSSSDNTGANNIRFQCSSNPILEGAGMNWGEYGNWSDTCNSGGICGIKTKMQDRQGRGDDTALNDVHFHCCDRTSE
ncbi:vitelline membrane outer layer protein 1 homolog [Cheilinus undulatus]|uniref:vitelline membrane outer layer protein 1 homolog n=1 Tax=Cheilinus undulatus TaxID=241271 RepID=UPI001BD52C5A|nr:vitelline membrane outer layer protein 1 homolog [Cheilinus undulatus]